MQDNIFLRNRPQEFDEYSNFNMMDYLRKRRRLSLLSPDPIDESGQVNTNRIPIAPNEYTNRSELYGMLRKSGEALDVLKEHTNQMPTRQPESTGRSIATSLLAGAAGFTSGIGAGNQVASTIRDHQYNRDIADWRARGAGLEDVADLTTSKANVLGRIADIQDRDSDRDADRQRKIEEEKNRHAEQLARIQEQRDERTRKAGEDQETIRHNREMERLRGSEINDRKTRTDAYSKHLEARTKKLGDISAPSITQDRQAEKDAIHQLIGLDPRFAKFAQYGNYNNPYTSKDASQEDQQDFRVFLVQLEQVKKKILAERQGRTLAPMEEEDDLEWED